MYKSYKTIKAIMDNSPSLKSLFKTPSPSEMATPEAEKRQHLDALTEQQIAEEAERGMQIDPSSFSVALAAMQEASGGVRSQPPHRATSKSTNITQTSFTTMPTTGVQTAFEPTAVSKPTPTVSQVSGTAPPIVATERYKDPQENLLPVPEALIAHMEDIFSQLKDGPLADPKQIQTLGVMKIPTTHGTIHLSAYFQYLLKLLATHYGDIQPIGWSSSTFALIRYAKAMQLQTSPVNVPDGIVGIYQMLVEEKIVYIPQVLSDFMLDQATATNPNLADLPSRESGRSLVGWLKSNYRDAFQAFNILGALTEVGVDRLNPVPSFLQYNPVLESYMSMTARGYNNASILSLKIKGREIPTSVASRVSILNQVSSTQTSVELPPPLQFPKPTNIPISTAVSTQSQAPQSTFNTPPLVTPLTFNPPTTGFTFHSSTTGAHAGTAHHASSSSTGFGFYPQHTEAFTFGTAGYTPPPFGAGSRPAQTGPFEKDPYSFIRTEGDAREQGAPNAPQVVRDTTKFRASVFELNSLVEQMEMLKAEQVSLRVMTENLNRKVDTIHELLESQARAMSILIGQRSYAELADSTNINQTFFQAQTVQPTQTVPPIPPLAFNEQINRPLHTQTVSLAQGLVNRLSNFNPSEAAALMNDLKVYFTSVGKAANAASVTEAALNDPRSRGRIRGIIQRSGSRIG